MKREYEILMVDAYQKIKKYSETTGDRFFMTGIKKDLMELGIRLMGFEKYSVDARHERAVMALILESNLSFLNYMNKNDVLNRNEAGDVNSDEIIKDILALMQKVFNQKTEIENSHTLFELIEIPLYDLLFESLELEKGFYQNNDLLIHAVSLFLEGGITFEVVVEIILFANAEWEKSGMKENYLNEQTA